MNFELNTSYTVDELKEISGDNINIFLSSSSIPMIPEPSKTPIYSFNDFDNVSKNIYRSIYSLVSSLNPDSEFFVFAVGKRVIGKWLSKQEANAINNQYNTEEKESPYEFWIIAKNLPSIFELQSLNLGVVLVPNPSNETHRVIIPPQ